MNNLSRKQVIVIVVVFVLIVGGIIAGGLKRKSAWNGALAGTGIEALPTWAGDKNLEKDGGASGRESTITFSGTAKEIADWTKAEPVLEGIRPQQSGQSFKYVLTPKGGAASAEVIVDFASNTVTIRTH